MKDITGLAEDIEKGAEAADKGAERLAEDLGITEENSDKIRTIVADFVAAYKRKKDETSDEEWLAAQFAQYPAAWADAADMKQSISEIVLVTRGYEDAKADLHEHFKKGGAKDSWLAKKIEQGASAQGGLEAGRYADAIDAAIDRANTAMWETIHRKDGGINQNPHLDGLIAEQHHVDTFNADAAVNEQGFYAETLKSTEKNSVDIVIKNSRGNIVRKYQSKYYKTLKRPKRLLVRVIIAGKTNLFPKIKCGRLGAPRIRLRFGKPASPRERRS